MKKQGLRGRLEQGIFAAGMMLLALSLTGTKACQEDYQFCADCKVSPTEAPTAEATTTVIGEITTTVTARFTFTPTPRQTFTPGPVITGTAAATASPTTEEQGDQAAGLLRMLGTLSDNSAALPVQTPAPAFIRSSDSTDAGGNWLGKLYTKEESEGRGAGKGIDRDSDGDGYLDWLEQKLATDERDKYSTPQLRAVTSLEARMQGLDEDEDGLPDPDETKAGTFPEVPDSDDDGAFDGAEILSGTDPLNAESRPVDADKDGLSDQFEKAQGLNPQMADGDRDGLRDDLEIALGTSANKVDTDGDGLSDGREFALGSDPVVTDALIRR